MRGPQTATLSSIHPDLVNQGSEVWNQELGLKSRLRCSLPTVLWGLREVTQLLLGTLVSLSLYGGEV